MSDFNARHTSFGNSLCNPNCEEFKHFITSRSMTVYDTDIETRVGSGRLDYVIGRNLVHANISCMLVNELLSDHFAILSTYTVDAIPAPKAKRLRISIPFGLHHHFKAQLYFWYSSYNVTSVDQFSSDLIKVVTD